MTKKYKSVFFDLDHTLWDYESNSRETLFDLFHQHNLNERGIPTFADFHQLFNQINESLWDLYDRNIIGSEVIREQRFKRILAPFEIHDARLIEQLSDEYLFSCPRKGALLPGAIETLDYLSTKYSLSLITNGFEDVQGLKLAAGKIDGYFKHMITSQKAGYKKPAREIFDYALHLHTHASDEAIMVGDNLLTDITGAKNAQVDTIFFNPGQKEHQTEVTHEIASLPELLKIL